MLLCNSRISRGEGAEAAPNTKKVGLTSALYPPPKINSFVPVDEAFCNVFLLCIDLKPLQILILFLRMSASKQAGVA